MLKTLRIQVFRDTLWNPYLLGSFPRIFRYVSAMRAFKVALPFNPELLDLLFSLTRDVRSLAMPNFSIKRLRLAGSTVPYCIAATELTHFHSELLLTLALGDFCGN